MFLCAAAPARRVLDAVKSVHSANSLRDALLSQVLTACEIRVVGGQGVIR
jgi:hypothetical protein